MSRSRTKENLNLFISVLPDKELPLYPKESFLPQDATGQMWPHNQSELRFSRGWAIIIINITFCIHL